MLAATLGLACAASVHAASQTWTNAPVDANWTTPGNWSGNAVPGNVNPANSGLSSDTATFNAPLSNGIGGTGNPIINDDLRDVKFILFDTANCGAYVIGTIGGNNLWLTGSNVGAFTGGNVTVNAPVASPQEIDAPVHIRLPSSTNGRYDIINNSTNSNATLTFDWLQNDSASSRPLYLYLDGVNTGANTIRHIDDNTGANGSIHVIKQGVGTWVLSGANDIPQKRSGGDNVQAYVHVNEGKLVAQDPASLGALTTANVIVQSNGVLQIDGIILNQGVTLVNGGTVQENGSSTLNEVVVSSDPKTEVSLATTSANDVLTVGNGPNTLSGGAIDTILHTKGLGTVLLAQPISYVGSWSVDAGTTQIGDATALGNGDLVNIGPGGTLDLSPLGAVSYTLSTANIGGSGTGVDSGSAATIKADPGATVDLTSKGFSLTFTPAAFSGDITHPSLYVSQGTLSLGGNGFIVNNASATPLGVGTYLLVQQASGNILSAGSYFVNVVGTGLAPGTLGSIQVTGGNVNLIVVNYTPKDLTWQGGNPDNTWDIANTANWLDGASPSIFNNSDTVTFNATGSANPVVNLSGALAPASVTVDTSANDYTFTGSGGIVGNTGLTKNGNGVLLLQTINKYIGDTLVNAGTLRIGVENALPSRDNGDVVVGDSGTLDLNGFNNTINALSGAGTVDNQGGGTSTLTFGFNDDSGTFSGIIKNTSGTLGITKTGTGTETLTHPNTYTGDTTINTGTLRVSDPSALGSGASPVTINGGTLDLGSSLNIASLSGAGAIRNDSSATTATLTILSNSVYNGVISDGSGGGGVSLYIPTGTVQLGGANTYTKGTVLASGTTLAIPAGGSAGSGMITASNNTTISLATATSVSVALTAPITTVDNGTVTFISAQTGNSFNDQFYGSANAVNVFSNGNMSIGGAYSFSNFLGKVIITGGAVRWFNAVNGGDNTSFDFGIGAGCFTSDATIVRLGALTDNGAITAPSVSAPGTYWIGAKNENNTFAGTITGSNNIVKVGLGTLTLFGTNMSLGLDDFGNDVTNMTLLNETTFLGTLTVSNGTLVVRAPNNLNDVSAGNPSAFTLAGTGAVLDVASMGDSPDGTTLETNGVLNISVNSAGANQILSGIGTIRGSVNASSPSSTVAVGLPFGTLNVTGNIELGGTVNMNINATNSPNSSQLVAGSITVDSTATLIVTNLGPEAGATFQLFNHPVSFANAPVLPALTGTNQWVNNLAVDGSITLLAPPPVTVNTTPTNITATVSDGNLTLTWPADHTGWRLQVQTNALNVGLSTNWFDVAGATATNQITVPVGPANGTVFYRMVYP